MAPSAEILLRGKLRVIGTISIDPAALPLRYACSFEKVDDGIVVRIDPRCELEPVSIEEGRVLKLETLPVPAQDTSFEGASLKDIAVQLNELIGEDMIDVVHS